MENWEVLVIDDDYEINTKYPYDIRRIGKKRIIKEYQEKEQLH